MSLKNFAFAALTALILSGCASSNAPTMTPLEIQSLQSKEYEAKKRVGLSECGLSVSGFGIHNCKC